MSFLRFKTKYDVAKEQFIAFIVEDEKSASQSLTLKEVANRIERLSAIKNLFVDAKEGKFIKGYIKTLDNLISRYQLLLKTLEEKEAAVKHEASQRVVRGADDDFYGDNFNLHSMRRMSRLADLSPPSFSPLSFTDEVRFTPELKRSNSPSLFSCVRLTGFDSDDDVSVFSCATPTSVHEDLIGSPPGSPVKKYTY